MTSTDFPGPPAPARLWRGRNLLYLVVVMAAAAALVWTALAGWKLPAIGGKQYDYYNLLVSGFRKGSLALDIEVPAALKNSPDPMALFRQSPGIAPHDLSLYRGHFYTYYGVAPAVVLFWPFRAIAGFDLPLVLGALLFALGALGLTAWLWLRLVREHFPQAGVLTEAGGFAVLALAAGQWVLLRRVSIWEPSIIAGHFFLMGVLVASYQALQGRRPYLWLAVAGLSLGLATGSRPTLVVAALGFIPLVWAVGTGDGQPGRGARLWRAILAVGLPLGAIGVLLLYYNWARFGNPLELGLNHQLSTWNEAKKSHFRPAYIPFNFYLYFLASPQWGRYFPFVHPIAMLPFPPGYYGFEYVYGALVMCPALWWLPGLGLLGRTRRPTLGWFAAVLAGIAVATMTVIFCFDTSAARYATDFLPWWAWLALLGWCCLESRLQAARTGWRRLVAAIFAVSVAVSCATAFFCSADLHGILHLLNPAAEQQLTRLFDQPTAWWERATGFRGGPLAMDLTFANHPIESVEPLMVTGVEYQRDYVYVFYQSDRVIRLCYLHPGEPVAMSADLAVVPGRTYPVVLDGGALYPPAGDPAYDGWLPAEVASRKHWARILFDGRVVVSASQGSNEASPGAIQIGSDNGGFTGKRFAGKIANVRRLGFARAVGDTTPGGDFAFDLELPSTGFEQDLPLVEFGRPGSADIAGISFAGHNRPALVYESFGAGIWKSEPLAPPKDGVYSLRLRIGSTLGIAQTAPDGILNRTIACWEDDRAAWWYRTIYSIPAGGATYLLRNGVGSSEMLPDFVGRVAAARRLPRRPPWRMEAFHRLHLVLGGRGEAAEPLVSTGRTGRADLLGIEWLPGNRAKLIYDHWGQPLRESSPFAWDGVSSRSLRIEMPSLPLLGQPAAEQDGALRVEVDGALVWAAQVPCYGAQVAEVAVGRNLAGHSSVRAELYAAVLDIGQEP